MATKKSTTRKTRSSRTKASKGRKAAARRKTTRKKTTKKKSKKEKTTKKTTRAKAPVKADETPAKPAGGKAKLKQGGDRRRKKVVSVSALRGYDKYVPVASAANGNGEDELSPSQLRRIKSGLTRKDLAHYREQLLLKRAELLGDVLALQADAKKEAGEGISYEHMADAGSDNFEQEFTLGLVEEERKLLRLINDALQRIASGIYGVCVVRGIPIGKSRLDAKPWAKYSIEVAREKERLGLL